MATPKEQRFAVPAADFEWPSVIIYIGSDILASQRNASTHAGLESLIEAMRTLYSFYAASRGFNNTLTLPVAKESIRLVICNITGTGI